MKTVLFIILILALLLVSCSSEVTSDDATNVNPDNNNDVTNVSSEYDATIAGVDILDGELVDPDLNSELNDLGLEDW